MSDPRDPAGRRAARLLRCYPPAWRERYGEEFAALLVEDIVERPRSLSRAVDVIGSGLRARLAESGLVGEATAPRQRVRAGLAVTGAALTAFLILGIAIWSQLSIGWQWSAPAAPATRTAMLVMSAVVLGFAAIALLAAVPVAVALSGALLRGPRRRLIAPLALTAAAATVLVLGSAHFGHGWPGTGGRPRAGRDIVPTSVAQAAWAATLWITSYWAHPTALAAFPTSEVVWMMVAPVALLGVLIGASQTLRHLSLSARVLRFEAWLCVGAVLAMAAFLAGAASWVVSGGPAPRGLFRVGVIDDLGIAVMTVAVIVGFRGARHAVGASLIRVGLA